MPQIIELSQIDSNRNIIPKVPTKLLQKTNNNPKIKDDSSFEETLRYLEQKYDKRIIDMETVAEEIGVSYQFIRLKAKFGKISFISYGRRKMIPIKEFARILIEGI